MTKITTIQCILQPNEQSTPNTAERIERPRQNCHRLWTSSSACICLGLFETYKARFLGQQEKKIKKTTPKYHDFKLNRAIYFFFFFAGGNTRLSRPFPPILNIFSLSLKNDIIYIYGILIHFYRLQIFVSVFQLERSNDHFVKL